MSNFIAKDGYFNLCPKHPSIRRFAEFVEYVPKTPKDKPFVTYDEIFQNRKFKLHKTQEKFELSTVKFYFNDDLESYAEYYLLEEETSLTTHPIMLKEVYISNI